MHVSRLKVLFNVKSIEKHEDKEFAEDATVVVRFLEDYCFKIHALCKE